MPRGIPLGNTEWIFWEILEEFLRITKKNLDLYIQTYLYTISLVILGNTFKILKKIIFIFQGISLGTFDLISTSSQFLKFTDILVRTFRNFFKDSSGPTWNLQLRDWISPRYQAIPVSPGASACLLYLMDFFRSFFRNFFRNTM